MTLGSLFDGIGGFPLAASLSGITPVWAAEIEPFCIAVTKQRFPDMLHLGDITQIDGGKIPPVDIITFGSPCQDLSVAGKREGLSGSRSGLFHEAMRIIYEMREATNGTAPTYIVWENVAGAFFSNKGNDFRAVLEEITKTDIPIPESGKWANAGMVRGNGITAAWRVLDAQYWGVPQRRKRIYLVGSFGSDAAGEILFEPEGVPGYTPQGRTKGKEAAGTAGNSVKRDYCFDARGNGNGNCPTLVGDHMGRVSDYTPLVIRAAGFNGQNSITAATLELRENLSPVLTTTKHPCVIYAIDYAAFNQGQNAQYDFEISDSGINSTLVARGPSAVAYCFIKWIVRRLTPLECKRLQGYPDYWTTLCPITDMTAEEESFWRDVYITDMTVRGKKPRHMTKEQLIRWHNKLESDSRRYKAIGNSLAIPCALRVIGGIAKYEEAKV